MPWVRDFCYGQFGLSPDPIEYESSRQARFRRADETRAHNEAARTKATQIIDLFNEWGGQHDPLFLPTLETIRVTGSHWLTYWCPACKNYGEADLSLQNGSPIDPIRLVCCPCHPQAPVATPMRLTEYRTLTSIKGDTPGTMMTPEARAKVGERHGRHSRE